MVAYAAFNAFAMSEMFNADDEEQLANQFSKPGLKLLQKISISTMTIFHRRPIVIGMVSCSLPLHCASLVVGSNCTEGIGVV